MAKNISLETWLVRFKRGDYNKPDVKTQIEAGWYDWFCRDSSLRNKTKLLGKKVVTIAKTRKLRKMGLSSVYVFFKNNCPMVGGLYDDFRICSKRTGNVIYTVTPSYPGERGKPTVYVALKKQNIVFDNWRDVVRWFNEEQVTPKKVEDWR